MNIIDYILSSTQRQCMPIAVYPGLEISGDTVKHLVTDCDAHYAAAMALCRRYDSPFVLTAMDLSVEAEVFGAGVVMSDDEVPTVSGRLLVSSEDIDRLKIPRGEFGRGEIALQTVSKMHQQQTRPEYVIGGMIGPYTLAARLFGVSEALELTLLDSVSSHNLLEKTTRYLIEYAEAFKSAGADAVCMAEPAAGLLWPEGLAEFSSAYIKRISEAVEDDSFKIILHNCGCGLEHLQAVMDSGVKFLHFGEPLNMVEALKQVPSDVLLSGNLNPSDVFVTAKPEDTYRMTLVLLESSCEYRNFLLSSGCDIPPGTSLDNLDLFYQALCNFNSDRVSQYAGALSNCSF